MASSPPFRSPAASPPNPAHSALPNPRKRGGGSIPGSSMHKRRKPSSFSMTSSSHPLRQTSFPPEEAFGQGERSPSVDSDYTTGMGAQSVAASVNGGKKRSKKKKDGPASVVSGMRDEAGDTRSKTGVPDEEAEGEDDDGDGGDDDMVDEGGKIDRAAEKKKLAVLMDAFDEDQNERYNTFRRVKLKKETVRKITNQTLSQSVPPSVVTTINGFTKVFVGTLIERARAIQKQEDEVSMTLPSLSSSSLGRVDPDATPSQTPAKDNYLGPLLPDHIREAFRRYRRDGEGGGAGVSGQSVGLGLPGGGAARMGGRRLFR